MPRFISLPNKILAILIIMSVALSATLSWLWISKTNQELLDKQQEIQTQTRVLYRHLNKLTLDKLESWMELFIQLHAGTERPLEKMGDNLTGQMDFLRLNWQIENIWLANNNGNAAYATVSPIPDYVREFQQRAISEQRAINTMKCNGGCRQYVTLPVLLGYGDVASVTMSVNLLDTMAFFGQSEKTDVAQVYLEPDMGSRLAGELKIRGQVSQSTRITMSTIIDSLPDGVKVATLVEEGVKLEVEETVYLVNLIAMTVEDDGNFIILAHDISAITEAHQRYQITVLSTIAAIVFVIGLFVYFLLYNIRKRLLMLSNQLPLLAKREYTKFRQQNVARDRWSKDELDTLHDSAGQLATELEVLDAQVLEKTQELEKIAMYDALTSLPNRNMLTFQLSKAIRSLGRDKGLVVILFFDLDDFKKVNDSYGHGVGDALLCEASERLRTVLRQTDVACRFGGDEFVVLLNHVTELDGALGVAEKLLVSLRDPINIDNLRFYISTSIGIAATRSDQTKAEDLIRHADIAMYQAKMAGGNCFRIYDSEMSQRALDKVELESEARDALLDNQFHYALQPQIELETNKLIGFEALIRWAHPERGFVSPGQFIPVLENTAFMLSLGYWCIDHAFELLQEFKQRGYDELKIAVNLSGAQFLDPELLPLLSSRLRTNNLPAYLMELELTERTLVADVENTTEIMQELIDLGFIISIDDFGTGYSSLSYLKRMPAHVIKIDRTFIDGMMKSNADKQIVASTISMVRNLGMKVVAEGIEESEQLEMLKSLNCDSAQGFYIAKPIPEDQLFATMDRHYKDGIWHIDPIGVADKDKVG